MRFVHRPTVFATGYLLVLMKHDVKRCDLIALHIGKQMALSNVPIYIGPALCRNLWTSI